MPLKPETADAPLPVGTVYSFPASDDTAEVVRPDGAAQVRVVDGSAVHVLDVPGSYSCGKTTVEAV